MTKAAILGALTGAFVNFHGAPPVADLNHTVIPVELIDKADVSKRHPGSISTAKISRDVNECGEEYPCPS